MGHHPSQVTSSNHMLHQMLIPPIFSEGVVKEIKHILEVDRFNRYARLSTNVRGLLRGKPLSSLLQLNNPKRRIALEFNLISLLLKRKPWKHRLGVVFFFVEGEQNLNFSRINPGLYWPSFRIYKIFCTDFNKVYIEQTIGRVETYHWCLLNSFVFHMSLTASKLWQWMAWSCKKDFTTRLAIEKAHAYIGHERVVFYDLSKTSTGKLKIFPTQVFSYIRLFGMAGDIY